MNCDTLLERQIASSLLIGVGTVFTIGGLEELPFCTGMAVNMLATRILSACVSSFLVQDDLIKGIGAYIFVDMTAALCVATIATVALAILAGIPLFSLATANLIAVTLLPSFVDTLLTAHYMSKQKGYS